MNRRNGMSLLRAFGEGPSLVSPRQASQLRSLVENDARQTGFLSSLRNAVANIGAAPQEDEPYDKNVVCGAFGFSGSDDGKPFAFSDGIAVIPVYGALLHRDSWCSSYATGYDFIRRQLALALGDPDVEGIVYDVNSYGGMVAGNFELCDEIFAARELKPSLAVVDAMAYSGGYSIASSASRMIATASGGVGSIGVVMLHMSMEKMLEDMGIQITFIHAGKHKVDGNPYENLPKDVRARYQVDVERSYDKFVSLVARNRNMDADAVRATEALCYDAEEAISIGLIDAIQTPAEALAAFRQELYGSHTNPHSQGVTTMPNETVKVGDGNASVPTDITATPAVVPAVVAASAPDAGALERERIQSITTCEEAKGRELLAQHFAFKTNMSADDARQALAAAPLAVVAPEKPNGFAAAMDGTTNPNVGAGGGGEDDGAEKKVSVADRIVSNYRRETGSKELRETTK